MGGPPTGGNLPAPDVSTPASEVGGRTERAYAAVAERGELPMRPLLLVLLWLLPYNAFANDDQITIQSAHSAPVTVQRLQEALTAGGWTILATVDHAAYAA